MNEVFARVSAHARKTPLKFTFSAFLNRLLHSCKTNTPCPVNLNFFFAVASIGPSRYNVIVFSCYPFVQHSVRLFFLTFNLRP